MDGDRVAFRILYQDAAASPTNALPPRTEWERPVDVNIACVPGFDHVLDYPETLLRVTKARYVMLGHWESFFRSRERRLAPIPFTTDGDHLDDFVTKVREAIGTGEPDAVPAAEPKGPHGPNWALPIPGETFRFSLPR